MTALAEVETIPLSTHPNRPGCLAGFAVCTRPVVGILTAICLHEHISRGRVCAQHLNKPLQCRRCLEHPTRPHKACNLQRLRVEPADGSERC